VTDAAITGVDGRALTRRGQETRQRLLDAAEKVFGEVGYHDASIVKITEAAGAGQGTFYLYFASKKEVFDELVKDLNVRVRRAMSAGAERGTTRHEQERLGFQAFFEFTAEHPALYRIIRQAEFVSPEMLHYHYDKLSEGYVEGLRAAMQSGEIDRGDPEIVAWALMGIGELVGMRWVIWDDGGEVPESVIAEIGRIIDCVLGEGS
jgi:AcrR family transcriptional regulator